MRWLNNGEPKTTNPRTGKVGGLTGQSGCPTLNLQLKRESDRTHPSGQCQNPASRSPLAWTKSASGGPVIWTGLNTAYHSSAGLNTVAIRA